MNLKEVSDYLNTLLKIDLIPDISLNGIQVGNPFQKIDSVALAVDASLSVIREAGEKKADLLLVHHGIFWGKSFSLTGPDYEKIKIMMTSPMSLYASHLPLDLHEPFGNNSQIAEKLGLKKIKPFGSYHGLFLGYGGEYSGSFTQLEKICKSLSSSCRIMIHQPEKFFRIAVVSGKCSSDLLNSFISSDYDLLITGEMEHSLFNLLSDWKKNVIALGHYESEKFGVLALGQHLQEELGLSVFFVDRPTGY